jgi:colanic acid biosynthesis glycosyl transferase WcaI
MRILFIGINYWPEETGIAPFNTGRAEYLAAAGHEVTVCTTFPYYPAWRLAPVHRTSVMTREVHNGVTILRSRIYVPARPTAITRIVHEASFIAASVARALAHRRPDVMFVVSPPLGLSTAGTLLGKLWGVPYVFHVADLQPDAALDLGMLRAGATARFLYAVERAAYRHAALISTLTPAMRAKIIAKGFPAERVALFSDWTNPEFFEVPPNRGGATFRQNFGLQDKFLVVHAGNMGFKQGLDVVLGVAELSRHDPTIAYLLVGDGAMRTTLDEAARAKGLDNVHFLPLQPRPVFLDLLACTDLALITQQRCVADIVFPSKVLGLLAGARPVVASLSAGSEVSRVLNESGAGVVVEPENPKTLWRTIGELRADPSRRALMGSQGRLYARRRWDRDFILPAMEKRLCSLLQHPDSALQAEAAARRADPNPAKQI